VLQIDHNRYYVENGSKIGYRRDLNPIAVFLFIARNWSGAEGSRAA